MSKQKIIAILKAFQKAPVKSHLRKDYFSMFEKRMVYRTTKSENPEVTKRMVNKALRKIKS